MYSISLKIGYVSIKIIISEQHWTQLIGDMDSSSIHAYIIFKFVVYQTYMPIDISYHDYTLNIKFFIDLKLVGIVVIHEVLNPCSKLFRELQIILTLVHLKYLGLKIEIS